MAVRKHGNRWQVRFQAGGKRIEETLPRGASKADAVAYEAKLRRQEIDSLVGRPERKTIGELLDAYEEQARSLKSYARDLRYRIAVLRNRFGHLDSTSATDVAERIGATKGLSAAAANRYLAIVRRCCNIGGVSVEIRQRSGEQRRSVYLSRAEVDKLAQAAGKWGDLIRFAALTGLRRSEILRLTQKDIRDGCVVLGSDTKSGRGRVVPLSDEGRRIAQGIPFAISTTNLNRVFRASRVRAGLGHVRFHDLRRTYGTWLAHGGHDLATVRDLLGHANISQTNTYLGTASVERLKKAVKGLRTR